MFLLKGFIDFLKVYVRKPRFLAMIMVTVCFYSKDSSIF